MVRDSASFWVVHPHTHKQSTEIYTSLNIRSSSYDQPFSFSHSLSLSHTVPTTSVCNTHVRSAHSKCESYTHTQASENSPTQVRHNGTHTQASENSPTQGRDNGTHTQASENSPTQGRDNGTRTHTHWPSLQSGSSHTHTPAALLPLRACSLWTH